ncbi:hypothetical protein [Pseudoalteromonas sp. BDTF-M6]|uniref:hypothetical protein n=1 Tax=Pseudoalteromonas sp. BDTF-M6 TaxID=2796132 RepID=UPI001BAE983B|nr:hypothetical protein [Pseudoalteromonas sp. BDTF-M6]MBS3798494.1 hypothetical protein [Pseudoalteromonas sp. BDTF-M6]
MKLLLFSIFIFSVSSFADTYTSHYGRSHTPYDQIRIPPSTFIVADRGYYNDVFRYRDDNADYEFTFELKINRFIGDDENIQKLIANNLISSKATIYLPVFDIENN